MKINRLETHDRLLHFKKDQERAISQGIQECLKKNPDSLFFQDKSPYVYIYAHPRTHDDGVNKIMMWQPRLTKPRADTNSYLFRAQSNTDILEICWMIPPREMWSQYKKKNVTEHELVTWSIHQFTHNKEKLEASDPEDLSEERVKQILMELARIKEENVRNAKVQKVN